MSDVDFDRDAALAGLKQAAVDGWRHMMELDPPEQVYGFMLYEGAEYGYVCVTAFTEEGLDQVIDQERSRGGREAIWYAGDDGRESMRWGTQESPHHVIAEVGPPSILSSEQLYASDAPWADDDEADERYKAEIRRLCMQALRELDEDGLFSANRDALTLLIEDRDGSESEEERRAIVAELNPPIVCERDDRFWAALKRVQDRAT
jgi:hypothetical protein